MKTLAYEVEAVDRADPDVWLEFYGCFADQAAALNLGFRVTDAHAPMTKYRSQKAICQRAGEEWLISFPEWIGMWNASGKWEERGIGAGKYCMKRIDRSKPYCVSNLEIFRCDPTRRKKKSEQQRIEETYGVSVSDFDSLEQMMLAQKRFIEQRQRASQRGIEWKFDFSGWWRVWKDSGLWESRGRQSASSAVMARRGDIGPYSKENVYIITLSDNFSEAWKSAPNRGERGRFKRKSKEIVSHI
jgi:hypothetical protein